MERIRSEKFRGLGRYYFVAAELNGEDSRVLLKVAKRKPRGLIRKEVDIAICDVPEVIDALEKAYRSFQERSLRQVIPEPKRFSNRPPARTKPTKGSTKKSSTWTEQEDATILAMLEEGKDAGDISRALDRYRGQVDFRIMALRRERRRAPGA